MSKISTESEVKKLTSKLIELLSYTTELNMTVGRTGAKKISTSTNIMIRSLSAVAEGKPHNLTNEEIGIINDAVTFLNALLLEAPYTTYLKKLVGEYIMLTFNWCQSTIKSKEIETKIKTMDRLLKDQMTITESVTVLKILLKKLRAEAHYRPPAFDASRAYLDSLKKEIELENKKVHS